MSWRGIVTLVLAAGLLAACYTRAPVETVAARTPRPDPHEQTWSAQGIDSYAIEVLVVNSIWHAQSHQITVRDGKVESSEATCFPAPYEAGQCQVKDFDPETYTVAGLFAKAQSQAQSEWGQWTTVTYDPTYGYPSQIAYNHPDMHDEDWSWRVEAFEVLK